MISATAIYPALFLAKCILGSNAYGLPSNASNDRAAIGYTDLMMLIAASNAIEPTPVMNAVPLIKPNPSFAYNSATCNL